MRRSMAARWASRWVCAVLGLLLAALSAWPVAAQGFGYAAIAVSPSTLKAHAVHGTTTEASVDSAALQGCQQTGANDCRVYSAVDSCVALAVNGGPGPETLWLRGGCDAGRSRGESAGGLRGGRRHKLRRGAGALRQRRRALPVAAAAAAGWAAGIGRSRPRGPLGDQRQRRHLGLAILGRRHLHLPQRGPG